MSEAICWGGKTRSQVLELADRYVGDGWLKWISGEEFDAFVFWARKTGVYFPDMDKTWDTFRGYCFGIKQSKQKISDYEEALSKYPANSHAYNVLKKWRKK